MTVLQGTMQDGTLIPVQVDSQGRLVAEGLQGPQGPPGEGVSHWQRNGSDINYTAGKVGIGTTSVSTKLHIVSNGAGGDVWVANGSGQNCLLEMAGNGNTPQTNSALYGQDASNNVYAGWARGAHPVLFGTNGTERGRWDSSGRFLVGTVNAPAGAQPGSVTAKGGVYLQSPNGTWFAVGVSDSGQLLVAQAALAKHDVSGPDSDKTR
jgi:hypothetical protein